MLRPFNNVRAATLQREENTYGCSVHDPSGTSHHCQASKPPCFALSAKGLFGCIRFYSGPEIIETIRDITRDPNLFRVGNYLQQNKLTIDTTRDPESIHESRDGE